MGGGGRGKRGSRKRGGGGVEGGRGRGLERRMVIVSCAIYHHSC